MSPWRCIIWNTKTPSIPRKIYTRDIAGGIKPRLRNRCVPASLLAHFVRRLVVRQVMLEKAGYRNVKKHELHRE